MDGCATTREMTVFFQGQSTDEDESRRPSPSQVHLKVMDAAGAIFEAVDLDATADVVYGYIPREIRHVISGMEAFKLNALFEEYNKIDKDRMTMESQQICSMLLNKLVLAHKDLYKKYSTIHEPIMRELISLYEEGVRLGIPSYILNLANFFVGSVSLKFRDISRARRLYNHAARLTGKNGNHLYAMGVLDNESSGREAKCEALRVLLSDLNNTEVVIQCLKYVFERKEQCFLEEKSVFSWLKEFKGSLAADVLLGRMYFEGYGVIGNKIRSYEIFVNCADKGSKEAESLLKMYFPKSGYFMFKRR
jgi:TPR repeat protein